MQALPLALPAAAAGLAYLNARYSLAYDYKLLSTQLSAQSRNRRAECNDKLNLFYMLESHANSSNRHHPWIISGESGEQWSYAEAYEIVLKYGTWLKSKGVQKEELVAMDFLNSEVFIWVWFGLWSIGGKPAFINCNQKGAPLFHTVRMSTARLILVGKNGRDKYMESEMREHGFEMVPPQAYQQDNQRVYGFDSDPARVHREVQRHTNKTASQNKEKIWSPQGQKLELIYFDKRLENHILNLQPIRLPDSARGGQQWGSIGALISTSGTTGFPKVANLSMGKAHLCAELGSGLLGLKPTDVFYTAMPLYHSAASIFGVVPVLRVGGSICIGKRLSHKTFWPEVRASKATIIQYVGEACRYLLSAPPSPLDKQHRVRAAFGNGLRLDVWEPFKERFGIQTIHEIFSSTEAPTDLFNTSTNSFSTGAIARAGTVASLLTAGFFPIIRIVTDSSPLEPMRDPATGLCQMCDYDEPGELLVKLDPANTALKFPGFWHDAEATSSKILRDVRTKGDAYFRFGDLVKRDKEGRWYFVDRIGDTFRWKAENVSTVEVAVSLGKHPEIDEANVYGVQVPHHDGRAGCAAVILKSGSVEPSASLLKSIAEHARKNLPAFAVPIWLRVVREMQTTGTHKQMKHLFRNDGLDVRAVEERGDVLFWLDPETKTYEKFTVKHLERIESGGVKL
ncbi:acetyl-CoA synthetase-like protein [Bimuria novae-zelandiae CBS 107.79]|uniref:Acetyl-CoA synthetase-like protein n=1 Tax=Bimuria novae-zelandiae CBS 107.79 TaxID=1447943 RepID=A0A6A5VCB4_9PLEO|nr:acetyl-CoA synthetase-like protein [Bimuria novae-zelandiae CBS 107.79]